MLNELISNILTKICDEGDNKECDSEVDKILSSATELSKIPIKSGNSIVGLGFGQSSDKIYVQRLEDADQVEKVTNILKEKGFGKHLAHLPEVGQLVACKWSEDSEIYRAEIMEVLQGNKVKVHFIDYGNRETEGLENVAELPDEVKSIPILASMIILQGVASVKKEGNKDLCDMLQEVEGEFLDDILKVGLEKNGEYLLNLSDGKSFNELLKNKLEALSREVTTEKNVKTLQEKLEKEAKQREDEEKRKEIEDQMKKLQEMLASMS